MTSLAVAVFTAKVLAIFFLGMAIGLIVEKKQFLKIYHEFAKEPVATFTLSSMLILVGMLMVVNHNVWARDWTVLVTLIGWGSVIKGAMMLALPQHSQKMSKVMVSDGYLTFAGVALGILGIIFLYFGYIAG